MADEVGTSFQGFSNVQRQDSSLPWAIYTGTEENSGRPVRLSVLWAPDHMSAERRRSVLDWFAEAGYQAQRLASRVIPIVLSYRSDADAAWVAVERPRGRPLREVIEADGPLAPDRAMLISGHIAAALAPAHSAGWAHGWLNGDTVWVDEDDTVSIVDLGLGLAVGPISGGLKQPFPTRPGLLATDPRRQDLQALGLLCTWMLVGRLPDPIGIPRADAFPKSVPAGTVKEIRALIDPDSRECMAAADWRRYAGLDSAAETESGSPFYESPSRLAFSVPRWVYLLLGALVLIGIVWQAARHRTAPTLDQPAATPAPTASTSTPPAKTDALTTVQVGPVQPEDEQATVDRLASLGYPIYVRREGDRTFIQVGAFANSGVALNVQKRLQDAGFNVRLQ